MTTVVTVRKEVKKIKEKIMPKPKDETWVVFWVHGLGDTPLDYEVECVEMYSGKHFKCKYGELDQKLKEVKQNG